VDGVPYRDANRLIWLCDIDLLARRLSAGQWSRLCDNAAAKGLRAVCLDGLRASGKYLGTEVPELVRERLGAPGPAELSAAYLRPGRVRKHLTDLCALRGWRARWWLAREWLFPPPDYLLRKYDTDRRWLLPWLYTRRAVAGLTRRRR
jgi:hypothetical protein